MFYAEANRPKSQEKRFVGGFNASAVGFPNLMLPISCDCKFIVKCLHDKLYKWQYQG